MDDLASKLSDILNSEEGQAQLRDLAAMLGGEGGMPDLSALFGGGSAGNEGGNDGRKGRDGGGGKSAGSGFDFGGIDIEMLLKLQSLMASMKDDKNSELLLALRPHLQDKNKQKVDQAVKILKLLSLLPIIKESGLLGGDFFGL